MFRLCELLAPPLRSSQQKARHLQVECVAARASLEAELSDGSHYGATRGTRQATGQRQRQMAASLCLHWTQKLNWPQTQTGSLAHRGGFKKKKKL